MRRKIHRGCDQGKGTPECGSTGTASTDYILSKILEDTVGAKFNSVLGYAGGSEIDIAVEKGEVVCRAQVCPRILAGEPFDSWHKKNFDRHLVQTARKRDSTQRTRLRLTRYSTSIKSQPIAAVCRNLAGLGRFWPSDYGHARNSSRPSENFARSISEDHERPEALAEAKKGRMDVEVTSGEELESLVKEIFDSRRTSSSARKKCWRSREGVSITVGQ